jgi:nitrite reductase (NADH) small subunit
MEFWMAGLRRVAGVNDIPPGKGAVVEVEGKEIALFNVGGVFYAVGNSCTHRGGPLGEGKLQGTTVTCPWHGSQFDVTNGQVLATPAPSGIAGYPTRVKEDGVWLEIP